MRTGATRTAAGVTTALLRRGRVSKYAAKPVVIDNIRFASHHEARVYQARKLELQAGTIRDLRWQVPFKLTVANLATGELTTVGTYYADFVYVRAGKLVVEDAKGVRTPTYKLKKRLVEALFGIRILES